jgi:phage gp46-like protein
MDILLDWNNNQGSGDWSIIGGDLSVTSDGLSDLSNAIQLSLFTDCRATPGFITVDGNNKGYWGDTYTTSALGSNLWQLYRGIKSGNTQLLLQARDYSRAALQWLINDGLVKTLSVQTSWISRTAIGILIQIIQPQQSSTVSFNYSWSWE